MGRAAVVKNYKEGKARKRGELQAQIEYDRKKPLDFKSIITDALKKIDALELLAVSGLTVAVHGLIITTADWLQKAQSFGISFTRGLDLSDFFYNGFIWVREQITGEHINTPEEPKEDFWQEMMVWITSFVIAFIVVRQAGQLMGLVEKGLMTVIPFFLGLA